MRNDTVQMWALWNFNRLMHVGFRRNRVRHYANTQIARDKAEANKMFRRKSLRITKVSIKEL